MKKEETASPELAKFFENLSIFKRYLKNRLDYSVDYICDANEELENLYGQFDRIFKTKAEENE